MSQGPRASLGACRRVVVKIGSRALAESSEAFDRIAADVAAVRKTRRRVVLVSSGAIALGMSRLGMTRRPRAMPALQAAAAAGQGALMQRWATALGAYDLAVAQVLLTHADLASRARVNNARAALTKLLELGAVPIINENDAVAVDEIRFGDNDALAAMVTPLCDGDLLVLLSDVEGLLDDEGRRVSHAATAEELARFVKPGGSGFGSGGMQTKLESARRATLAGAHAVIASAHEPNVVYRLLGGEDLGTVLPARRERLSGRKHWIAYTLRPRGAAIVDDGAARAIVEGRKSVLCVGVMGVRGQFEVGDMIAVVRPGGEEIARGLARLGAHDAARLCGLRADPPSILLHRDDLVLV